MIKIKVIKNKRKYSESVLKQIKDRLIVYNNQENDSLPIYIDNETELYWSDDERNAHLISISVSFSQKKNTIQIMLINWVINSYVLVENKEDELNMDFINLVVRKILIEIFNTIDYIYDSR